MFASPSTNLASSFAQNRNLSINNTTFLESNDQLEELRDKKRQFGQLLENDGFLAQQVADMIAKNQRRLIVHINRLRSRLAQRADDILNGSSNDMIALESALCDYIGSINPNYYKQHERFFIGYEGSFGANHVNPRTLNSDFLGKLVCVEGIVTKCNNIHPRLVKSVHYCPATKKTYQRFYSDLMSLDPMPSNNSYPTKDDQGNLLETEFGLSIYKDTQNFMLQELPEKSPVGQLPRSLEVICEEDLVDQVKPGDRCLVIGSFRCLPGKRNGYTNASFRTILLCNNIKPISNQANLTFIPDDIQKIREFILKKKNIVDIISESIAPSIWGNSYIKKALLCQLIGGTEKILPNGTRLRGDINIMLLGDPSVAKSQFLRYIMNVSPRAISTTGRGSTGVGLTAAVTIDPETHERRLEAGAMVLADRGIVCIDEFDKMLDSDKTAIHEVMEQGKVTIAKAGIQAQLNARCSVLAAANPVWGKYDEYKSPMENIGMQDSLLSRFDLLFIVLDTPDVENDSMISEHVLNMHIYRPTNQSDGEALSLNFMPEFYTTEFQKLKSDSNIQMFDNFDYQSLVTIKNNEDPSSKRCQSKNRKILSVEFFKKYLQIAKNLKPDMTDEACDFISEQYSKIRSHESEASSQMAKTQPITPRSLETLIRIATAHAKARFSLKVTIEDAEFAVELLQYCLFKKVVVKNKSKRSKKDINGNDSDDNDDDSSSLTNNSLDTSSNHDNNDMDDFTKNHHAKRTKISDASFMQEKTSQDIEHEKNVDSILLGVQAINETEFEHAKQLMSQMFQDQNTMSIDLKELISKIETSTPKLSQSQISQVLERMEADNQIMLHDDIIYLI